MRVAWGAKSIRPEIGHIDGIDPEKVKVTLALASKMMAKCYNLKDDILSVALLTLVSFVDLPPGELLKKIHTACSEFVKGDNATASTRIKREKGNSLYTSLDTDPVIEDRSLSSFELWDLLDTLALDQIDRTILLMRSFYYSDVEISEKLGIPRQWISDRRQVMENRFKLLEMDVSTSTLIKEILGSS